MKLQFKRLLASVMVLAVTAAGITAPQETLFSNLIPVNSITASAVTEYTSGDYKFTISDNKATITKYLNTSNALVEVTIPKTVKNDTDTYNVVAIGDSAFSNKQNITKVTINSNVKAIGSTAFQACNELQKVIINGKPELNYGIFTQCKKLNSVKLSNSIETIPFNMFWKCTSLTTIALPTSLTKIDHSAFQQCSSLQSITIPSKCSVISRSAFEDCTSLSNITFMNTDTSTEIQPSAFKGCSSLAVLQSPANANIGYSAFRNSGLQTISINGGNIGASAFENCRKLKEVSFSGDNVILEVNAFYNCPILSNINISSMRKAKDYTWNPGAFENCPKLLYINNYSVTRAVNSVPVLYNTAYTQFLLKNFYQAENVGFCSVYGDYYCDYVLETQISPNMTDLQKAKAIHDWIIEKVDYDHINTSDRKNHITNSIFLNDRTVCEGYARGYAKLMNKAGIQTYYLSGGRHAWNLVNICGDYFHVDCCHDDSSAIQGADPEARYPIPKYGHFLQLDKERHESLKPWEVEDYTGDPQALKTLHPIGDVTGNGVVSANDASYIRAWLAGNRTLTKAQRSRADVNLDGKVTIADAILIDQFPSSGYSNFHDFFASKLKPTHQ
ncbi:leucine-rich repeat protein [Ruminococcus sp.]|uniref:leucine-rich repeat protein n=1 Tax=Ruminococcus sp. TaxID=41978 RepID=UPI0025E1E2EA|nr:leucine-rich repeat protein [Ruminococcus sp.]